MSGLPLAKEDFLARALLLEEVVRYIDKLPEAGAAEGRARNYLANKLLGEAVKWHQRAADAR